MSYYDDLVDHVDHDVHIRLAEDDENKVYLDCDTCGEPILVEES